MARLVCRIDFRDLDRTAARRRHAVQTVACVVMEKNDAFRVPGAADASLSKVGDHLRGAAGRLDSLQLSVGAIEVRDRPAVGRPEWSVSIDSKILRRAVVQPIDVEMTSRNGSWPGNERDTRPVRRNGRRTHGE